MIEKARRKELVREYRERKQPLGIYAVRCEAAGKIWIAATKNLDRQKNGIWFQLRGDGHPNKAMTSAWKTYGEASFRYESRWVAILSSLSFWLIYPVGERMKQSLRFTAHKQPSISA